MFDVIVVGAGPAGCAAAKGLSEAGFRVLLAEKFKMPRNKSCSGVLIKKSLELVRRYFGEEVPQRVMCAPTLSKGMIFTDAKGREYRFEQEGRNIWRASFDQWLAAKAKENGTQVWDGTAAVGCETQADGVAVSFRGEHTCRKSARYVIDCEGVVGSLKRKLWGDDGEYITTFQTFNQGSVDLDGHYFYAYLQPEFSEYDAWFNAKDDLLVLGVAVRNASCIRRYYERFLAYLQESHSLEVRCQMRTEKWLMPRIRPGCPIQHGAGRILFAGEAAGFLSPMGEGISAAIQSGRWAAEAVMRNFGEPQRVLLEYQKSTGPLRAYMRRQWSFVGGMSEVFEEMKPYG